MSSCLGEIIPSIVSVLYSTIIIYVVLLESHSGQCSIFTLSVISCIGNISVGEGTSIVVGFDSGPLWDAAASHLK
jgi:hypothetical protein